jgi:hypothetical protein
VVWKLGIVLVIGYVILGITMSRDPQRPRLNWRAAQWIPVWLIGLGIISWQGVYSGQSSKTPLPPVNTGHLHFWYDMLVTIVFSLIICFWAMHSRLPREEMFELVAAQSTHDDPLADIHE